MLMLKGDIARLYDENITSMICISGTAAVSRLDIDLMNRGMRWIETTALVYILCIGPTCTKYTFIIVRSSSLALLNLCLLAARSTRVSEAYSYIYYLLKTATYLSLQFPIPCSTIHPNPDPSLQELHPHPPREPPNFSSPSPSRPHPHPTPTPSNTHSSPSPPPTQPTPSPSPNSN